MKKFGQWLIAAMISLLTISVLNVQALEDKESLVIGFDETFVPFGFKDDNGDYVGFDIDLAEEVFGRMELEYEFQPIDWTLKETELNSGNIDMIWNGYTKTKEREEIVEFSNVYNESRQVFVVMKDNDEIYTREDMAGKVIATQDDSSPLANLQAEPEFMATFDGGEPVTYPSYVEVFADLENGRADLIVVEDSMLLYYLASGLKDDDYRILDESEDLGMGQQAVGFRKEDKEFVEKFNETLQETIDDGTFDEIKAKWLSGPEEN